MSDVEEILKYVRSKNVALRKKVLVYLIQSSSSKEFAGVLKSAKSQIVPEVIQNLENEQTRQNALVLLSILSGKGVQVCGEIGKALGDLIALFEKLRIEKDKVAKSVSVFMKMSQNPVKEQKKLESLFSLLNYVIIVLANITAVKSIREKFLKLGVKVKDKEVRVMSILIEELVKSEEGSSDFIVNILINCTKESDGKEIMKKTEKGSFLKLLTLLDSKKKVLQYGMISIIRNLMIDLEDYRFVAVLHLTPKILDCFAKVKDDVLIKYLLDIIFVLGLSGFCLIEIQKRKEMFEKLYEEKRDSKVEYLEILGKIVEDLNIQTVHVVEKQKDEKQKVEKAITKET